MQSRRHSLLEASLNTLSGFIISLAAAELIFPALGMSTSHSQNFLAVAAFTGISVVRSYAWRRGFNWWQHRQHVVELHAKWQRKRRSF